MILKEYDYDLDEFSYYEDCQVSGNIIYDIVELEDGTYSVLNDFEFKNISGIICAETNTWIIDEWGTDEWDEEDFLDKLSDLWQNNGGGDNSLLALTEERWNNENNSSLQGHYVAYFKASYDVNYDRYSELITSWYDDTFDLKDFYVEEKDGRKV